MQLKIGSILENRYLIIRQLGTGGMGTVYLVEQTDLKRKLALKILSSNTEMLSDDDKSRFVREGQMLASLNHPGIVKFYHFGFIEEHAYLAMEYVEGKSLRQCLNDGNLPWTKALNIAKKVCEAVYSAHRAGIVHRDLKPENILFVDGNEDPNAIKIIDFGLGRFSQQGKTLTATGLLIGSPVYMSPEQCQGRKATTSSDVYSTGIILYEMISGSPPFVSDSPIGVLHKHINEPWLSLAKRLPNENLPTGIDLIFEKSLAKDPNGRYTDIHLMSTDIEQILSGRNDEVKVSRSSKKAKFYRAHSTLLVVLIAIAGIITLFYFLSPKSTQNHESNSSVSWQTLGSKKHEKDSTRKSLRYEQFNWYELKPMVLTMYGNGSFIKAIEILNKWLAVREKRHWLTPNEKVEAIGLLVRLHLQNSDPTSGIKAVTEAINSFGEKASDTQMVQLICTRLSAEEWTGISPSLKADADLLEKHFCKSEDLSNEHKSQAYISLIEARIYEGRHSESLRIIQDAPNTVNQEVLRTLKIRVLLELKRDDEALQTMKEYLKNATCTESLKLREDFASAAAHAERWDISSKLLKECLQLSKIPRRTLAYISKNYAESSMAAWSERHNKGPNLGYKVHREEWMKTVKESAHYYSVAKDLFSKLADMQNCRLCAEDEYCCLTIIGESAKANKVLDECLSQGNIEETKQAVASNLWRTYSRWSECGWKEEALVPLKMAVELYNQLPQVNDFPSKKARADLAKATKVGK